MTCKCTCGGCDCPQFKVTLFPNAGCAEAGRVNYQAWLVPANGAQNVTIGYLNNNACAAAAAPLFTYFPIDV